MTTFLDELISSYAPTELPVISLWQPWASLIFAGVKKHETRGFPAPAKYAGARIAVHATAKFPPLKLISEELHELCLSEFGCSYNYTLPLGAILGTAVLSAVITTDTAVPASNEDRIAGDWSAGRYAWRLTHVRKFASPISAKGKQGWWRHICQENIRA